MSKRNPTALQTTLMLMTAPLMGALFCVFLPFIGIFMLAKYGIEKLVRAMRHIIKRSATTTASVV